MALPPIVVECAICGDVRLTWAQRDDPRGTVRIVWTCEECREPGERFEATWINHEWDVLKRQVYRE